MTPFIVATDLHGIEQDGAVVESFLSFLKEFDPKNEALRVFLGDLWNLAALRRQADEHEKVIRLKEDFQAGLKFLDQYRPSIFLRGNHDQRLWDSISRERVNRTGWLAELAGEYVKQYDEFAKKLGIKTLPYDKRLGAFRHEGLTFSHGFGSGENMSSNMAKNFGDVIHGHGHRIERVSEMRAGRVVTAYQVGCLCRDDMEYARADLGSLKQQQGWAFGYLLKGTAPVVYQVAFDKLGTAIPTAFKRI